MGNQRRNTRSQAHTRRRSPLPPLVRRLAWRFAATLAVVVALLALGRTLDQPIDRVVVSGRLQHVSPLDVEQAVRARLRGAGFVTVNLDDISGAVGALPWVDSAAVQRSWPRGLRIDIVEQVAVARWNGSGLVNARGVLFIDPARFLPPELPELNGPQGTQQEVTARYLGIQGQLTEAGLRLTTLELDARGAWHLTLDNGVSVRLGREQVDARFERFMLAAAKLVRTRATDIAYIDMRYSNGFAVGWRGAAHPVVERGGKSQRTGDTSHLNG